MNQLVAVLTHVSDQRAEILQWEQRLAPIANGPKRGRVQALELLARQLEIPFKTVLKKFYAYKKDGLGGLVDRRKGGRKFWKTRKQRELSAEDKQIVKTWCEKYQRSSRTAIHDLRAAWRRGEVRTSTPIDPRTGYPVGWSERTLYRHAPTDYELAAARLGRGAAAAYRPLVYTTRRGLYVGQYYLFDDLWHDHEVNLLETQQSGRPLEFHGLDLASAYKMCWGIKMRREVDGKNQSLNEREFRFLLAGFLFTTGFNPRGTTLILENATTNISELIERLLFDATGGAIKTQRGAMDGAAAHAGQYAGRAKGNYRFKAALESLGNLIHNRMSYLPAQVGKDRQHSPEQLHGLNKYNDALLVALSQLPPERAKWLLWPKCTLTQFQLVAAEIYARINARTEHKLEGWDENYVPCRETGRMRRMSPLEVWRPGTRALQPLDEATVAAIIGTDGGKERSIHRGMFELTDRELSGDIQRYDATALPPRGKFLTVINPFQPDSLWCYDAKGNFVRRCERIHTPCRGDEEAVQRQMGRAAAQEKALLAPMQTRHLAEARERVALKKHNARVMDLSRPFTEEEKADRLMRIAAQRSVTAEDEAALIGAPVAASLREAQTDVDDATADEISSIFATGPTPEGDNDTWP
jgi:hypothetical protein